MDDLDRTTHARSSGVPGVPALRRGCRENPARRAPAVDMSNERAFLWLRATAECDGPARLVVARWRFPHRRTFIRQPQAGPAVAACRRPLSRGTNLDSARAST